MAEIGTMRVKSGLAEMLKGGVIMDVTTAEQARIAEDAGAVAVMALERVPADIRREGGVARMADPDKIREIQEAVSIPVMAKARIGHLGEALRRIAEGAAMIRTKGEAGTGDIVNAVTHMRAVFGGIRRLGALDPDELYSEAKTLQAPVELVRWVAENGRLPVVTFTAGGIATPADANGIRLPRRLHSRAASPGGGLGPQPCDHVLDQARRIGRQLLADDAE